EWLDLIMQRLDYCEQLDFIQGNYTQWCEHALEGAYDWIDSMRDAEVDMSSPPEAPADIEATEELLLRKLTSEEDSEVSTPEPPTAEKQPAGAAPFESISAQVAQVSPPEEVSLVEPEDEAPEPTAAIEQAMDEQQVETVKASEAAHVAEEN